MNFSTLKQQFSTVNSNSSSQRWSQRYWLIATPIVFGLLCLLTFLTHQHIVNQMSTVLVLEMDRFGLDLAQKPASSLADLQARLLASRSSLRRTFSFIDGNGAWIDSAESPSPYRQSTNINPVSAEYTELSQLFTVSGLLPSPAIFVRLDSAAAPVSIIAQIDGKTIFAEMLKLIFPFAFILINSWLLIGWALKRFLQQRTDQLQRLAAAAIEVTQGKIDTSIDIGEGSSLGMLGSLFDQMRRALKSQIDESTLQLTTSQAVAQTINVQEGIPIVLKAINKGISADGSRAIVVNPAANSPFFLAKEKQRQEWRGLIADCGG